MKEIEAVATRLKVFAYNPKIKLYNGLFDDLNIAVKAVEKQIPKKPKIKYLGADIEVECPCCGYVQIFLDSRKGHNYCQNCGIKLDWSE